MNVRQLVVQSASCPLHLPGFEPLNPREAVQAGRAGFHAVVLQRLKGLSCVLWRPSDPGGRWPTTGCEGRGKAPSSLRRASRLTASSPHSSKKHSGDVVSACDFAVDFDRILHPDVFLSDIDLFGFQYSIHSYSSDAGALQNLRARHAIR